LWHIYNNSNNVQDDVNYIKKNVDKKEFKRSQKMVEDEMKHHLQIDINPFFGQGGKKKYKKTHKSKKGKKGKKSRKRKTKTKRH